MWFTHPLRHKALSSGFRRDAIVIRALVLLSRRHDHPLSTQRVIWIHHSQFVDVMMGSMQGRRSAGRGKC